MWTKNAILAALLAAILGGCAAPVQRQARHVTTQTPSCENKRQCDAMWAEALDAVGLVTGMRNRIATDTRIETFAPASYGNMGGVVTKLPIGESGYQIRLSLECYRSTPCRGDLLPAGMDLFNNSVTRAGLSLK